MSVRLALVVPCYNEEAVLGETCARLTALLDEMIATHAVDPASRIVFVDDGSRDRTWALIEQAHRADPRVHGLKLSRNRGHQNALLAGLLCTDGDAVISLDADLQDDLAAIPKMVAAHAEGADIVYGVRRARDVDTRFKRWTARGYYGTLRRVGVEVVPDHADFRLMSRRALDALRDFREVNLFLRGVIPLIGFRTAIVHYDRLPRLAGESKYPLHKMLSLAMDGILAFSTAPLRWITWIGMLMSAASIALGLWALGVRLFTQATVPGWASIVVPVFLLGGLQLLALGVIGAYVARIYAETKQRPRFIVEKSL